MLDDARGWLVGKGLDALVDSLDSGKAQICIVRYPDDSGVIVIPSADADSTELALWVSRMLTPELKD